MKIRRFARYRGRLRRLRPRRRHPRACWSQFDTDAATAVQARVRRRCGKDVAMQIAAANPELSRARPRSPPSVIENEKEILLAQIEQRPEAWPASPSRSRRRWSTARSASSTKRTAWWIRHMSRSRIFLSPSMLRTPLKSWARTSRLSSSCV